jgi:pSer/pThr/pTyr-binding forkhead associated (FHA) protein
VSKLVLKFDSQVLKEVALGASAVTIGRAPDNDIHIDNLAVSNHHARVYTDEGRLVLEDLDSLNGTFLNQTRVKREWLNAGDNISIGKHVIVVDKNHDVAIFGTERKIVAPKVDETVILDSRKHSDLLGGARKEQTDASRSRVPRLVVLRGKTDQTEYSLSSKLIVIGKSSMATVRLRGWFAPQVVAQIAKRQDGYYLVRMGRKVPKVNGEPINPSARLNDGDSIEIGKLQLKFSYAD